MKPLTSLHNMTAKTTHTNKGGIKMLENELHPLEIIYGSYALEKTIEIFHQLKQNSNFTFDNELIEIGISFLNGKAHEIINHKKDMVSLKQLVTESFGEASIYKFNIKGD